MTIEAALGTDAPFDDRLQRLRPHPGQAASASNLRRLLEGSPILASHRDSEHLVQDAYSLRCAPQVHGATRDALGFARGVLEIELNAVSDNPIVLPDDGDIVSGGNFHGQPVAVAMDSLALATVGMASISERRLYRLLDPALSNGLPAVPRPRERSEQRVHARAVHGGVARLGVEVARASGLGRFDPFLGRAGGPRVDGDDGRATCAGGRRERGDGRRARGARRRAGARPPRAARARSGDRVP